MLVDMENPTKVKEKVQTNQDGKYSFTNISNEIMY